MKLADYLEAGFASRIPFDMFECVRDRGGSETGYDEAKLRRWCIDHEDEMWDTVIGPAIDRVQRRYEEETGDGS